MSLPSISVGTSSNLRTALLLVGLATFPGTASAAWVQNGSPVCSAPGSPLDPVCVADRADGVVVAWTDPRDGFARVYARRVLIDGTFDDDWPVDGVVVSTTSASTQRPSVAAAPDGGTFILVDHGELEIRLVRLTPSGQPAGGWPPDGRRVGPPHPGGTIVRAKMIQDASGSLFVLRMLQHAGLRELRVHKLSPEGEEDPSWPADGVVATSVTAGSPAIIGGEFRIESDFAGGVWVYDRVDRNAATARRFLVHLDATGSLPAGWPGTAPLELVVPVDEYWPGIPGVALGDGSYLLSYNTEAPIYVDVTVRRISANGAFDTPETLYHEWGEVRTPWPDGLGGAWIASHWAVRPITNVAYWRLDFGSGSPTLLASDGIGSGHNFRYELDEGTPFPGRNGELYIAYTDEEGGTSTLRMDRLGTGQTMIVNSLRTHVLSWCGTSTSGGGLVLFWVDDRNGVPDLYVAGSETAVAVRPSVGRVDAQSSGVRIEWWIGEEVSGAVLERQEGGAEFSPIGHVERLSPDVVVGVDEDVVPGASYVYRLRGATSQGPFVTDAVTVDVPGGSALRFAVPSPQRGGVHLRIDDPGPGPGPLRLVLRDVAGRRVAERTIDPEASAEAQLGLDPDRRLPSGVFFLTVERGASRETRRVVLLP